MLASGSFGCSLREADGGEISGVVDWEGAGFTFKDQDLEDLRAMGGAQEPDARRLSLMELLRELPCVSERRCPFPGHEASTTSMPPGLAP